MHYEHPSTVNAFQKRLKQIPWKPCITCRSWNRQDWISQRLVMLKRAYWPSCKTANQTNTHDRPKQMTIQCVKASPLLCYTPLCLYCFSAQTVGNNFKAFQEVKKKVKERKRSSGYEEMNTTTQHPIVHLKRPSETCHQESNRNHLQNKTHTHTLTQPHGTWHGMFALVESCWLSCTVEMLWYVMWATGSEFPPHST